MGAYVVRRLLYLIPVLALSSVAIWGVVYLLPGSPATVLAGDLASPEQIAVVEARLGLDRPIHEQYLTWVGNVISGDLGESTLAGRADVSSLVRRRAPASFQLGLAGMLVGLAIALPAGVVAGLRPRSALARLVRGYEIFGLTIPTFWLAILLTLLFSVTWNLLPSISEFVPIWEDPSGALRSLALPALTLGLHVAAITTRFVASAVSDALRSDYIRTARSKGISEAKVVLRHVLPNSMIPVVTVVGLQLGGFLGGTVVTEVVFNYPGLGRLIANSVFARDYPVIQGSILLVILVFLLVNLVVDLSYGWLDPRVRIVNS